MRITNSLILLGILLPACVSLAAGTGAANHVPGPGELFVSGANAYREEHYAEAAGDMGQYLDARAADVNDPRLGEARKMFLDCVMKIAAEQVRNHHEAVAANFLMEQAGRTGVGSGAANMKTAAQKDLRDAETLAEKNSDYEQVLDLAQMWTQLFPDERPLVETGELNNDRLAALTRLSKSGPPESAIKLLQRLKSDGMSDSDISAAGVNAAGLMLKYAQDLFDRGWYRQAAVECQNLSAGASPTPHQTTQAQRLAERALSMYMASCQKFGNAKMIEEATTLYAADSNPQREPFKARRFQATADSLKGKDDPQKLTIPGKVAEGNGAWLGSATGFTLDKEIIVGDKKTRGVIEVGPGFVLQGGTLTVSNGSLEFKGTPDKPIILRGVALHCEFTGSITAANTLFIDCTLQKTGGWYWIGGYSSKWELNDCMLVGSHFAGLGRIDYGIKWKNTTFVDCDLPDRDLNDDPGKDAVSEYHGNWNKLTNCFFYDCNVSPSILWGAMPAFCFDCDVAGTSRFTSTTSLDVPIALAAGEDDFLNRLMMATRIGGAGMLDYTTGPPPQVRPSPLWQFVPEVADATASK